MRLKDLKDGKQGAERRCVGGGREEGQEGGGRGQGSCCLVTKLCPTLCDPQTAAHQASLSLIISWSLLRFISTELVMLSNHLILCHPLLLLPSIFPSIRVSPPSELALHIRNREEALKIVQAGDDEDLG